MRELDILTDESGDFGVYEPHARYYIIALVLHRLNQYLKRLITQPGKSSSEIARGARHPHGATHLPRSKLRRAGHRRTQETFRTLFNFPRHVPIGFRAFLFKKKGLHGDHDAPVSRMSREISSYVKNNLKRFQSSRRDHPSAAPASRRARQSADMWKSRMSVTMRASSSTTYTAA